MERSKMKPMGSLWVAAIAAGLLTSLAWLPQTARGELVFEDGASTPAANTAENARVEDRGALRQSINASERARDTRQAEAASVRNAAPAPQAPATVYVQAQTQAPIAAQPAAYAPAPVAAPMAATVAEAAPEQSAPARAGDSVEDLRNMNKTELMRRERVREELRNEDALQERLEELRLRDEKRRTDQILGVSGATGASGAAAATGPASVSLPTPIYSAGLQEQAVAAPVTDHPGQAPQAPAIAAAPAPASITPTPGVQLAGIASENPNMSVMTASAEIEKPREKAVFSISPRAGIGNFSSSTGYDISGHFAAGVTLGVAASDYVSFEMGYTYAEYGVNMQSTNPWAMQFQNYYNQNSNTLAYKQNVVDAGLKLNLMDSYSRIRPFIGGGGAWSKGYLNYNQQILNQWQQYGMNPAYNPMATDYEVSAYYGYLSAGLDVKVSQNVSIGLLGKYYALLTSSTNGQLNPYAFYNPYAGYQPTQDKQAVGGAIATSSFYNASLAATFSF